VGRPRAVAWDVIEVCEFTWRDNCVFEMTERQADGALVRVKEMIIEDMTAPASIHAFGSTQLVYYTEAPLRIDTAACDVDGVVHVEVSEVEMLRGVAARATSRAETSTGDTPTGRRMADRWGAARRTARQRTQQLRASSTLAVWRRRIRCSPGARSTGTWCPEMTTPGSWLTWHETCR